MKKLFSPVVCWILAGVLFVAVETLLIMFVDRPLSEYLRGVDARYPDIIDFFRAYTDLGKGKWYEWPTGIGALLCLGLSYWQAFSAKNRKLLRREGRALGFIFACVAVSGLITDALKPMIGRARPVLLDRQGIYRFDVLSFHSPHDAFNSLPSGHATTAFALAFAIIALWPRGRPWLITFAVALATSRVMVNAHYLSDILAGALVGTLTALFLQKFFVRKGWIAEKV